MRKRNHVKNSRIGKALSMVLAIMLSISCIFPSAAVYTMRKELNIRYLRNTSNALERILKEENLLECNDLMSLPDANQ